MNKKKLSQLFQDHSNYLGWTGSILGTYWIKSRIERRKENEIFMTAGGVMQNICRGIDAVEGINGREIIVSERPKKKKINKGYE